MIFTLFSAAKFVANFRLQSADLVVRLRVEKSIFLTSLEP